MTDIDGLIEYRNRAIIIYEVKSVGADVPRGQRLALERLVNDCHSSGKVAIAAVLEHTVYDTQKPVHVKDCTVRELYYGAEKRWRKPKRNMSGRQLTDAVIDIIKKSYDSF